jgi:hypothetical protein
VSGLLGDRRERIRCEVDGRLWASLNVDAEVVLRNVSTRGALIETPLGTPFKPVRVVRVNLYDGGPAIDAVVRHVRSAATPGEPGNRHLVGLEFVNMAPAVVRDVERFVRGWHDGTSGGGLKTPSE